MHTTAEEFENTTFFYGLAYRSYELVKKGELFKNALQETFIFLCFHFAFLPYPLAIPQKFSLCLLIFLPVIVFLLPLLSFLALNVCFLYCVPVLLFLKDSTVTFSLCCIPNCFPVQRLLLNSTFFLSCVPQESFFCFSLFLSSLIYFILVLP